MTETSSAWFTRPSTRRRCWLAADGALRARRGDSSVPRLSTESWSPSCGWSASWRSWALESLARCGCRASFACRALPRHRRSPRGRDRVREKLAEQPRARERHRHAPAGRATTCAWLSSPESVRRLVLELQVHRIIIAPTATDGERRRRADPDRQGGRGYGSACCRACSRLVGSSVAVRGRGRADHARRPARSASLARRALLKRAFDLDRGRRSACCVAGADDGARSRSRSGSTRRGPSSSARSASAVTAGTSRSSSSARWWSTPTPRRTALRDLNEVGDGFFKITDDPRITRTGQLPLRKTSLDEIPQFFINVLRGDEHRRLAPARPR